eukprot:CAMPEP_0197388600 /NCGR_PEP_ID=MMETSP1165-20131217/1165_1 /TAXON_ID=284809 /ORGANISM="Chrysocystis fragilis, Strain CCMP3189" /LENGTH=440 /DNA_ID=CAMNT_0042913947 /DNA_START=213 /DNA_END=1531 /DNA_ORIENTATION=-
MASMLSRMRLSEGGEKEGAGEVKVVVVVGACSPERARAELAAIERAMGSSVVACRDWRAAAAALRSAREKGKKKAAAAQVILHVIGHVCGTAEEKRASGRRAARFQEKTLRRGATGRLEPGCVEVELSMGEFVERVARAVGDQPLELAFCNASTTATLAKALRARRAFGWRSACVEQGACALASAFYAALGCGCGIEEAFTRARDALAETPVVARRRDGSEAAGKARLALADPEEEGGSARLSLSLRVPDLGEGAPRAALKRPAEPEIDEREIAVLLDFYCSEAATLCVDDDERLLEAVRDLADGEIAIGEPFLSDPHGVEVRFAPTKKKPRTDAAGLPVVSSASASSGSEEEEPEPRPPLGGGGGGGGGGEDDDDDDDEDPAHDDFPSELPAGLPNDLAYVVPRQIVTPPPSEAGSIDPTPPPLELTRDSSLPLPSRPA